MKRHRESRKDKGDVGGSIILKVVCEELCVKVVTLCVCDKVVCERLFVTKLCVCVTSE